MSESVIVVCHFQNMLLFDEMTMVTMPANLSAEYFFIFIELQVALKIQNGMLVYYMYYLVST